MEPEKLAWRDRFVHQLVQDLSAYSEGSCEGAIPQIISGEENYVILKVSLEEWTKLFSSVFTGADFCYPDESDNVRWILQRAVECPVSICDLIIDCIQNNPATLQAIIDGLEASEEFNDFINQKVEGLTIEALTGELVAGSCDNAVLAGKMMALVTALDTNNADAIEIVEFGTNDEEKVASVLEGIPIAGELPFGDIILFIQDMFEDLGEGYLAASTTDRKEALARDLWCLAQEKEACALNYADLFDFFNARVSNGLTLESLVGDILEWIITGEFSTPQLIFDAFMAAQIAFVRVGKDYFGINAPRIGALTRDASPSSIWEEWDPCIEPPALCEGGTSVDWREGENGFAIAFGRATYYPSEGWGLGGGWTSRCSIEGPFSPTPTIFKFTSFRESQTVRLLAIPSGALVGQTTVGVNNGDGTFTYEIEDIVSPTATMYVDCGSTVLESDYRMLWACWNYDV